MSRSGRAAFARVLLLLAGVLAGSPASAEVRALPTGAFALEMEVTVAGTPDQAFRAFTAETLKWWDHHFSEAPSKLYFETRPGGSFLEVFPDGGGARHAVVDAVEPGKMIRFTGPLGFSGHALSMTHTLRFQAAEGGTRVRLELHGHGELEDGWADAVEGVWQHFLVERFKPYMAAR